MMKRIWIYALAALALVSCVRELRPEPVVESDDGLVERTWTVSFGPETRATLDEGLCPVWEVGEKLSIYDPVINTGRAFTVTSVSGHRATITGRISDGDFPINAIYPSKSAGAWTKEGTNRPKLPATQSIPSGRNVCPDVLVSMASSEHQDELLVFHNAVSLLKFRIAREGLSTVRFELSGDTAKQYTVSAAEGTFALGDYYLAVDPASYSGISVTCSTGFDCEYTKASDKPLEAKLNGILNLGTVSDGKARRTYSITSEKSYATQQALIDETGVLNGLSSLTASLANLALITGFPLRNTPVHAFNITHPSADPQGRPVTLSARIYIPEAALNGEKALDGIAIANHGTIASNPECPTMSGDFEAIFAWKNYAIVMSDYYGFGASKDRPQAFLDPETTARGTLNAYYAALQLIEDRNVSVGSVRFNFGYSQGGFNTLANLRYLKEHPELDLKFTKSFAGGGPYDVPGTWSSYLTGNFGNAIGFIPLTLVSMNESQQLGLDYATLFKEPLLSNWREWILSKKYNMASINSKIGQVGIADILTADMVAGRGTSYETIMATAARYSLISGWEPDADSRIWIYHSTQDDIVPYSNLTSLKSRWSGNSNITWQNGTGDHVTGCISFILNVLNEWKP